MENSPSDLLQRLTARFPVSHHKDRDLPGGGRYIYVPWERYVDLLNEVCGLNWGHRSSDFIVSGNYLSVRVALTIYGVTREGVGTTRTYPDLNDEGKEKIIGDPPKNGYRNAFVDACYHFGIGRYLDNQNEVRQWFEDRLPKHRIQKALRQHNVRWQTVADLLRENQLPQPEQMTETQCEQALALITQLKSRNQR